MTHPALATHFWFVIVTGIAQVLMGGLVLWEGLRNFVHRCKDITPLYLEH